MKWMGYFKAGVLALAMVLIGLYAWVRSYFVRPSTDLNFLFIDPFSKFARWFVGIKLEVIHPERAHLHRPCIMVGNHQTGLDFAIISQVCPKGMVIVAKKELKNIPIFGSFFVKAGNLMIDRAKSVEAKNKLKEVRNILISSNKNLAIFPEGTRHRRRPNEPGILPLKNGAFEIAILSQLPIVPVVCSNLSQFAIWEKGRLKPGVARVSILEPIQTEGLSLNNLPELKAKIYQSMLLEFEKIST